MAMFKMNGYTVEITNNNKAKKAIVLSLICDDCVDEGWASVDITREQLVTLVEGLHAFMRKEGIE